MNNKKIGMETKFKAGDRVRCIDSDGASYLKLGEIYTVIGMLGYFVVVDADKCSGFWPCRFELVEEQNEIKQMKHLKIGDKVRYVRNIGSFSVGGPLVLGSVYTVKSLVVPNSPTSDVRLVEMGDHSCYSQRRFELVEEQNEIKQMNNKPDAFWIYVNSPIVSEFIQKLLFKNGFGWNTSNGTNIQHSDEPHLLISFKTRIWGNKTIHYSERISETQFPSYDAVKDLPKIMELLETPSVPLPVVNGYTMEYKKDDLTVRFGCAEISTYMLFDAKCLMISEAYKGNRKIAKITLDSGVVLTKNDIENILKYVEFVNKK